MNTKFCNSCKLELNITFFGKDKHSKSGYTDYCKQCRNAKQRAYFIKNPEVRKKINDKQKFRRKEYYSRSENKRKFKNNFLKQSFGISIEQYDELLFKQNEVCAICKKKERTVRNRSLAVDHCHKTGKIRGLLCSHCNRALGLFGDDHVIIENAKTYLTRLYE